MLLVDARESVFNEVNGYQLNIEVHVHGRPFGDEAPAVSSPILTHPFFTVIYSQLVD